MNFILIELFVIVLSTSHLSRSADDEKLNAVVNLLKDPQTNCSEFMENDHDSFSPIFVDRKYPILRKIISNQTLSVYFNQTLVIIEKFLIFFDNYYNEMIKNQLSINNEKLKYFLGSFKKIDKSIKSIGLCLNDRMYHSDLSKTVDYICKYDIDPGILSKSADPDPFGNVKRIKDNIHRIKWDPVACIPKNEPVKFPVRIIYSIKFHLMKKPSIIYFEFNTTEFKLDQCAVNLGRCGLTTTCIYNKFPQNPLFSTGNYYCRCKDSYFMSQKYSSNGFPGTEVEKEFLIYDVSDPIRSDYFRLECDLCKVGCKTCTTGDPCIVSYETKLLRGLPLAIQSFCITMCIVTGIIIFQLRRTRVVKNSNWILLELFLLGAILIYCTIINAYFKPSEITCAIQPFLREGGFVLMYGVLYVKVYRVLCSFQSRKAQRVYVRDQDILRYLGVLVIICMGHLVAWLATGFDHMENKQINIFLDSKKLSKDLNNLITEICRSSFWGIVSYLYEAGLLALTIYNCKCVKSAPSEYGEVRFVTIAVINELLISMLIIVTRMSIITIVHPDYIFLIDFIHCHATATISVLLLIGPKMWYLYRPPITSVCKPRLVPHTESHIIQTQQKLNGDVDLVEINLAEMDCETIRDELKRLYTQLEIYKTRAMRKDNPHVSRKRGGRKQRRFSLQHFHKKHHTTSVHDDETSKISEDSPNNSGGEEATLTSSSVKS